MENSRDRVLRELRERGSAQTAELVEATQLHENTVREQLTRLYREGLITREQDPPLGRGRPRTRWRPVDASAFDAASGMAIALSDALADGDDDAMRAAHRAGREWGSRIVDQLGPEQLGLDRLSPDQRRPDDRHGDSGDPRELIVEVMRRQGFEPDSTVERPGSTAGDADASAVRLRNCPLLSAARHSPVVCAVHAGLIDGLAAASGLRARLEPFAADGACLLRMRSAS